MDQWLAEMTENGVGDRVEVGDRLPVRVQKVVGDGVDIANQLVEVVKKIDHKIFLRRELPLCATDQLSVGVWNRSEAETGSVEIR